MSYRLITIIVMLLFSQFVFSQQYSARTAHLYVQSANKFANIEADNYQINSTIDATTGKINLLGLLKSFEFRIGGLDQAFNSKLVNVLHHPKFKYIGKITNLSKINFARPGTYPVQFQGTLYLWDQKRVTPGNGTMEVKEDGSMVVQSDLIFKIEQASVNKANELIQSNLPDGINLTTDKLGISRSIKVQVNGKFRKKRASRHSGSN